MRERLHIVAVGTNFEIALIIELPIPDDPPVTMITEVLLNNSEDISTIDLKVAGAVERFFKRISAFFLFSHVKVLKSIDLSVSFTQNPKPKKERIRYGAKLRNYGTT